MRMPGGQSAGRIEAPVLVVQWKDIPPRQSHIGLT